jgi:dienelactone hydrolase
MRARTMAIDNERVTPDARGMNRRKFLEHCSAAAVALALGGRRAAWAQGQADSEALPGSPRWPGSFRASDFYNRAADLSEVMQIGRRIPEGDVTAYLREWTTLRDRALAQAERLERERRSISAGNAYLRASNYSGRIYNLYLRLGDRSKGVAAYRVVRDQFNHGIDLFGDSAPLERVRIPYQGKMLAGFFFPVSRPVAARWPAVYRTGGADSVKENSYHGSTWAPFLERGVSCLVMDAPGQGEALNQDGLNLPATFETAVTAAVDYLSQRPDVDSRRIGVYGTSMGGYFAGRGAAFEKRPVAVVLQSTWYDVLEDSYNYCPSFRPHVRYMIGAGSDAEARRMLAEFNFRGLAEKIEVPISIVHGEKDDVVRVESAKRLVSEISSREKQFKIVPGAHHNLDGEVLELVDWICARLVSSKETAKG